jgi:hypothetical protein
VNLTLIYCLYYKKCLKGICCRYYVCRVISLYEAGVLDRMTSLEYARLGQSTSRQTDTSEEAGDEETQTMQPLSAKMLQGAFFVLLAGYAVAGNVYVIYTLT